VNNRITEYNYRNKNKKNGTKLIYRKVYVFFIVDIEDVKIYNYL